MSSSNNNGQSMIIYPSSMKHFPSVVIVSWQRSKHGYSSLMYETCFVGCHSLMQRPEHVYSSLRYETGSACCHRLITTIRAWSCIPEVWNMLCQLPPSPDNGQSMVMYSSGMKHALSVAIFSWQRSENGNISLNYDTCSDSWHRLMTTVRTEQNRLFIWHKPYSF